MNPLNESQGRGWLLLRTATLADVGAPENEQLIHVRDYQGRTDWLPMARQPRATSFWPRSSRETADDLFLPSIRAWMTLEPAAGAAVANSAGCRLCHFPCRHHLALTAQVALKGLVSNTRAPWRAQPLRRPSPQNGRGGDALWQKNVGSAAASGAAVSTARGLTSRSFASDAASSDWEDIGATGGRFALPTT